MHPRRQTAAMPCLALSICLALMPADSRAAGGKAKTMVSTASNAETQVVEAERLVGAKTPPRASGLRLRALGDASGGTVLATWREMRLAVRWKVSVRRGGTHYFWLRARSGWHQDYFLSANKASTYTLHVGAREISLVADRQSLVYNADSDNFVWFRSEPLNLDPGEVELRIGSRWGWAHMDVMMLTSDPSAKAPQGNIARRMSAFGCTWEAWTVDPYLKFDVRLAPPAQSSKPRINLLVVV